MSNIFRLGGYVLGAAFAAAFAFSGLTTALLGSDQSDHQRDALLPVALDFIAKADAQGFSLPNGATVVGHLLNAGAPPVLSSCGSGPTMTAGSSDFAGSFTVKQASCVMTFAATFTTTPFCIVRDQTTNSTGFVYSVSATAITISGGLTSNDVVNYLCIGRQT